VDLLSAIWLAGEIWQILQRCPDSVVQIQPAIHENNAAFLVSGKDVAHVESALRANPNLSVALTMRSMERYGMRTLRITEHHRHRALARKEALDPDANHPLIYEALSRIFSSQPATDDETER
jgi:hypothetical protein